MNVFIIGEPEWHDNQSIAMVLSHLSKKDHVIMCDYWGKSNFYLNVFKGLKHLKIKYETFQAEYSGGGNSIVRKILDRLKTTTISLVIIFHDACEETEMMKQIFWTCRAQNITCINIHHGEDDNVVQTILHTHYI